MFEDNQWQSYILPKRTNMDQVVLKISIRTTSTPKETFYKRKLYIIVLLRPVIHRQWYSNLLLSLRCNQCSHYLHLILWRYLNKCQSCALLVLLESLFLVTLPSVLGLTMIVSPDTNPPPFPSERVQTILRVIVSRVSYPSVKPS